MSARPLDLRTARARVAVLERKLLVTRTRLRFAADHPPPLLSVRHPDAFVTICQVTAGRGSFLHALDGHGVAWRYNFATDEWNSLGMRRGGPVAVPSVAAVPPAKVTVPVVNAVPPAKESAG